MTREQTWHTTPRSLRRHLRPQSCVQVSAAGRKRGASACKEVSRPQEPAAAGAEQVAAGRDQGPSKAGLQDDRVLDETQV